MSDYVSNVQKQNFRIDLPRLTWELENFVAQHGWPPDAAKQWCFTHTKNCPDNQRWTEGTGSLFDYTLDRFRAFEKDFTEFNSDLKGSYLHWIYQNVPFKPARMRLMCLSPKTCLTIHQDTGPRFHFAIKTNPSALLLFPNQQEMVHIPADGFLYQMNAATMHSAMNADPQKERWHLVTSDLVRS